MRISTEYPNNKEGYQAFKKACEEFAKKHLVNKETARQALVDIGIYVYTKEGDVELHPNYK